MSDFENSISFPIVNEKLKYIDLEFDKEFSNEINPDRLKEFYFQAFSNCSKMIQDSTLKEYTSFPICFSKENICFIVKKEVKQKVDNMFTAMGAKRDKKRKVDILNLIPGLKISVGYSQGNIRYYINLVQIDKNFNDDQFAPFIDYVLVHQYRKLKNKLKDNGNYKQIKGEYKSYQELNNYDQYDSMLFSDKTNDQQIQVKQKYPTIKNEMQSQLIYANKISNTKIAPQRNIIVELENEVINYKNELIKIQIDLFNQKIKKHNAKTHLYQYEIYELQKRLCLSETITSINYYAKSRLDQSYDQIQQAEIIQYHENTFDETSE